MLQSNRKRNYSYDYSSYNKNIDNRRESKSKYGLKTFLLYLIILVIIGFLLVSYICQFVKMNHLNYQLAELENKFSEIQKDNEGMQLKLAQHHSLARVERIARKELNMVEPGRVEHMVLNNNKDINNEIEINEKEEMFVVKIFDNMINRLGTARAKEF